ncbi:hypothetical protein ACPOL_5532 [Acidisarcina polymorpha]|uniref:Uncharacterized protein n=2 Tax=Acidisarcina polymorpha TaxID=2211140 RepID=A0A2Z5G740_9BACT|nr:hypothetical protein ACPOL_5532 [Acidisarcina polymorpha]
MFFSALLLLPVFSPHATATVTASAIIVMLFVSSSIGELLHLLPDLGRATASLSHACDVRYYAAGSESDAAEAVS